MMYPPIYSAIIEYVNIHHIWDNVEEIIELVDNNSTYLKQCESCKKKSSFVAQDELHNSLFRYPETQRVLVLFVKTSQCMLNILQVMLKAYYELNEY